MKRHFLKEIAIALFPIAVFLVYAYIWQTLRYRAAFAYEYNPIRMFNLFAPVIVGAILCAVLCYGWINRASTVFIALYFGAFIVNVFIGLCNANIIQCIGTLELGYAVLLRGTGGCELVGVIDGAYIVMFWISLVNFIKSKKKNKELQKAQNVD